jgi:hypothetical protein
LVIFGTDYASLSVIKKNDGVYIVQSENINADKNKNEIEISSMPVSGNEFYLKVKVSKGGICDFSYESEKGSGHLLKTFNSKTGRWVGAKIGLFCTRTNITAIQIRIYSSQRWNMVIIVLSRMRSMQ